MSKFKVRQVRGRNEWAVRAMPNRHEVIAGVMVHSTRSGRAGNVDDLIATENWGMNPSNGSWAQGWGSYWDEIVGRSTGERVICTDWDNEYAAWTAGFGGSGTWGAGIYYIQIEVCQARYNQPFSDTSIESLAESVAEKSVKYGFPLVRIPYLTQKGTPPKGICTHEDSANGRRLGKTDPGSLFPWAKFLRLANEYKAQMEEPAEDEMKPEEVEQMVDAAMEEVEQRINDVEYQLSRMNLSIRSREQLREIASDTNPGDVDRIVAALEAAQNS